ncbi:phosphotransferase [Plantactinospora sp. ZYX-F-223]|uniref:phosphotransferase family protein n=1 Tax=Plantactinospora sp. ZYX-F-223 TaxID=3144103 RepID=UPI0031FBB824
MLGLARALAGTHLAVHQVPAPADLPPFRQVLAAPIHDAVMPPHLRDYALRVLGGLPDDDRRCHGDYHPGYVLVAADRVAVIDWPNAARGTPEADHARTMLLLRWADPLPDTTRASRALITAGRSTFAHAYARAYRAGSPQLCGSAARGWWSTPQPASRKASRSNVARSSITSTAATERQRGDGKSGCGGASPTAKSYPARRPPRTRSSTVTKVVSSAADVPPSRWPVPWSRSRCQSVTRVVPPG